MRHAWVSQEHKHPETNLANGLRGGGARQVLGEMRKWDFRVAQNVDYFIAISKYIQQRISRVYGRESIVIYPPVDTDFYNIRHKKEKFYLAASRMVPYKMMPLIVSAFAEMPEKQLVVIGDGPEMKRVRRIAGSNARILGYLDNEAMRDYMQRARCFIFAAEEDFGILPVEAQACGTPVVGYGAGGLLETVKGLGEESPTGVFFYEQSKQAIKHAVLKFEQNADRISPENCRNNALRFSEGRFRVEFTKFVDDALKK